MDLLNRVSANEQKSILHMPRKVFNKNNITHNPNIPRLDISVRIYFKPLENRQRRGRS